MFPYDPAISAAIANPPNTIPGVIAAMQAIDRLCTDTDGLKWFNWLYLQVTQAVENKVATGGFSDPAFLADLDVRFAALYFNALNSALNGNPCPGCWRAMFALRNQTHLARIQFALAGMNAHINHDLALAIVSTAKAAGIQPRHGTAQYNDYTALDTTLDSLIDQAKQTLKLNLLGDPLPPVGQLEDLIAAWNI